MHSKIINKKFLGKPRIQLRGFSSEKEDVILEKLLSGAEPSSFKGDFLLIVEGKEAETGENMILFASTIICAVPHYYCSRGGNLYHGPTVFDCCKTADLNWKWDIDAIAQLTLFDHLIGDSSLHSEIKKVPAASVMRMFQGKLSVYTEPFFENCFSKPKKIHSSGETASVLLEILEESLQEEEVTVSLSAGYESRLLLACCRRLGKPVSLMVMGEQESTDPRIAKRISDYTNNPLQLVNIRSEDYGRMADYIVRSTSGEKTFNHWHTGIYVRNAKFNRSSVHVVGANGEFARNFYFDRGWLALSVDKTKALHWHQWLAFMNSRNRRVPELIQSRIRSNNEMLWKSLSARKHLNEVNIPVEGFLDSLSTFYSQERVRNFIGHGMKLYRKGSRTTSPFLDARFIKSAAQLPNNIKLGDSFPRSVIRSLEPQLLDFPVDDSSTPMRKQRRVLYYLRRKPFKGYAPISAAKATPEIQSLSYKGIQILGLEKDLTKGGDPLPELSMWNLTITLGAVCRILEKENLIID